MSKEKGLGWGRGRGPLTGSEQGTNAEGSVRAAQGAHSHLLLLVERVGLLPEALQLLLGVQELPGRPLQLPCQLLVGESQLGVLSLGLVLVIVQGGALAFQLERRKRVCRGE